ncbi:inositol transporter 4-like [Castanea sativa]|uniref:inositol transporter 4-like n=1 Tax=Castanea sativa TaxID=21020 RepID=UPI003F65493F
MVEGGIAPVNKTEFTELFRTIWKTPYILRLAMTAGIGGLLFGYDTAVISGALLYLRDDFKSVDKHTWLQELIVSTSIAAAIIGAAIGAWMNDSLGRKKAILTADVLFFVGSLVMAVAPFPSIVVIGRILVGLGVGMTSMTSPLYISETSPARIRGALISMNGFLLTFGQFLSYLINLGFTKVPGTWRWMLGVAGIPPIVQFVLMLLLPESPRWLYKQGKVKQATEILGKIYPIDEVGKELEQLKASIEAAEADEASIGNNFFTKFRSAMKNIEVRRALYAGVAVQVVQQFVGINSVMYYGASIMQLAGFASKAVALALSLVTTGLNAVGSIISMLFMDRQGRRRMMIVSLVFIIIGLVVLSAVFYQSSQHAPGINNYDSSHFGINSTCTAYISAPDTSRWNCMTCLKQKCGFCASEGDKFQPGSCLANEKAIGNMCTQQHRVWYDEGCPSKLGMFAVLLLGFYIIVYSLGMGTGPWIVNAEIYPLKYRGFGGGVAAMSNWTANLIVSMNFLSLTEALGTWGTFLLFAGFSFLGLIAIYFLVPETKGVPLEEIEKVLRKGFRPWPFERKEKAQNIDGVSA